MLRNLRHISTRVSLVILALGFSLLGALSLISRVLGNWALSPGLENDYCFVGGGVSIFAGLIFFGAACAYWRR
jgi:hypothetical protein